MKRLCTGFRGRSGVPHRKIRDMLPLYFRQLQRITRLSCCRPLTALLQLVFQTHFAKKLPVPDELSSLPTGMSRVKIDCYLTAINPGTGDHHLEKLPADEYDRLFRLVKEYFSNNDVYSQRLYLPEILWFL